MPFAFSRRCRPSFDGASTYATARNSAMAIVIIESSGFPAEISFDYDLGGDDTAMPVAKRLIELDLDQAGTHIPRDFHLSVHRANPVGRENIRALLAQYLAVRTESESEDET